MGILVIFKKFMLILEYKNNDYMVVFIIIIIKFDEFIFCFNR